MKKYILYFFAAVGLYSCTTESPTNTLFVKVAAEASGLHFNNQLTENDSMNIIDNEFVYNGAGVALGDLNNDGLDDIFFTGNQVPNKLFLNSGELKFKDISNIAQITKPDTLQWSSGATIIDINLDGLMDIYVCNTFRKPEAQRANFLYINQGNNADGIPTFKDMAAAYNMADTSYSSHAQFFDYDQDGDLDLWIGVNCIEGIDPNVYSPLVDDGTSISRDRLYQSEWDPEKGHPVFTDVSEHAGIKYHGYSHSTLIHDFNADGWMDVYVANDFLSNDLIYINNQDGTFTNRAGEAFKHFSFSAMGSDIADVNNDGQMDIYTTEMQPYYNKRKKLFQGPSNYQKEIFSRKFKYQNQYFRNTLQLNRGINPETGIQLFSDTGMFSGVQETDWSWAPLFGDYDNDGWQDLLITNGFPKDVTDRDFGDFKVSMSRFVSKEQLIAQIPEIKVPNFVFRNKQGLQFEDSTKDWGLNFGTYSNGAAYGDLDNDGDLDLVINNINDPALLLENTSEKSASKKHYVRLRLKGEKMNPSAIGAVASVFSEGLEQRKSVLSGRGYLSQPEHILHFGLGEETTIDSIRVQWPNGHVQLFGSTVIDDTIEVNFDEKLAKLPTSNNATTTGLYAEVSKRSGLLHKANESDFIDFNYQRTLPHKFSQYGPSLSVGDINEDGLDDLFVSGSGGFQEKWFVQKTDGTFDQKVVSYKNNEKLLEEDAGTLLFDADNDGDLDLYIARGGGQFPIGHDLYQDVLYLNDGKGNFKEAFEALPILTANSSAVKAADFDQDGDLDLFVGSRVLPFSYPMPDRSYILRNDSTKDNARFVDVTKELAAELTEPGMVCDALWTDFNNDSWPDLILASELMPLRIFKNTKGSFKEITDSSGLIGYSGWWNSLASADLDNDGDLDYVAGNVGRNINFKGDTNEPIRVYAKDLDDNGTVDPLLSFYLRDSVGIKKEYLYHPWQDVTAQYVGIRKKYNSFGAFGAATLPEMFSDGLLEDAEVFQLNYMQSSWIENLGNGQFKVHALPVEAQLAPIYGILPMDINEDEHIDLVLVGNDYGMETQQGKADAFLGLVLKNNGNGDFLPLALEDSHFLVAGDAKALVTIDRTNNNMLLVASQNNDSLRVFSNRKQANEQRIKLARNEIKVEIEFADGRKQMREFYWGNSFQSQSSRSIPMPKKATAVRIFDASGNETRVVSI